MAIQTDLKLMAIGDKIICEYIAMSSGVVGNFLNLGTSVATLIPAVSSTTPSGSFYYIYVGDDTRGRKILIADRNVQKTIAWDVLNTAGIAGGSGVKNIYTSDLTNGLPGSAFSASSIYSGTYPASKAFDNVFFENNSGWQTASAGNGQWIQADFGVGVTKSIAKVNYQLDNVGPSGFKNFKVQASNDNTTWVDQGTFLAANNTTVQSFYFTPTGAFRYWRLQGIDTWGNVWAGASEIEMFETVTNANNTITRLLTGGTSSTDIDDEWDKYIVNSTLGGTITAGDNNVWNWSGINTWSSTSTSGTSGNRALRGNTANNGRVDDLTNATIASYSLRPVLVVDIPPVLHLFQDGTNIKYFSTGTWNIAGTAPATETMFFNNGMLDTKLITLTNANLQSLVSTTPSLLTYTRAVAPQAKLTAIPPNKLVFPTGDISISSILNINSLVLTATQAAGGVIAIITSIDSGVTWKTWNGSAWAVIDSTNLATVKASGMTIAIFNARTNADWSTLVGASTTLRFAYYLEMAASTDTAFTDTLTLTADMKGIWRKAVNGTDYNADYTGNTNILISIYANGDYKINY